MVREGKKGDKWKVGKGQVQGRMDNNGDEGRRNTKKGEERLKE